MTLAPLDIALPIGLGIVFGLFRYSAYRRVQVDNAIQYAAVDALKGMAGIALITLAFKFFSNT